MSKRTPYDLYHTLLKPISPIATDMLHTGVMFDTEYAKELKANLEKKLHETYIQFVENVGIRFNYRSPIDLEYVIQQQLGEKLTKKTPKGNLQLDEEVIDELVRRNSKLKPLKELRHISKMISTYIDSPMEYLNEKNRVSPGWHLLGTETGRWSSRKPFAIQTIPRDKKLKRLIRAQPGYIFIAGDFKQAELRILAYYSQDSLLLEGARKNKDLHSYTAGIVNNMDPEEIIQGRQSKDPKKAEYYDNLRQEAKSGNFLVVYRGGPDALSRVLGKPKSETKVIWEKIRKGMKAAMAWSDSVIEELETHFKVTSCYGRERRFPLYCFFDQKKIEKAHKEAPNALIQGTSSDFCSYSLIETINNFRKDGKYDLQSDRRVYPIMHKHDELLFEIPEDWLDRGMEIIKDSMESPKLPVDVPMAVDLSYGTNYAELKEIS
ncbi:MAG: DNA polymerase [Promethearchaeota archaeon]